MCFVCCRVRSVQENRETMVDTVFRSLLLLWAIGVCSGYPKGPCHIALLNVTPGLIGTYVPQCTADGNYKGKQCHASTGYCWCMTRWGKEIPNTKTRPGQGTLECADGFPLGPCHEALMDVVPGLLGADVPQCRDDGWYESKQYSGSTGYCWCVTKQGRKIPGTERGPGQGDVECIDGFPLGPCHEALMDVVPGLLGADVPQCRDDGWYESKQYSGSTGYCWCVTKQGKKIPGTERGPGQGDVECIDGFPLGPCHEALMDVVPGLVGAYVPQCTDNGWYESRQCHGSTGYCWCVTLRGQKIPWTERGPGQGDVECTQFIPLGPCQAALMNRKPGTVGGFYPKCTYDGWYKCKQCSPLSGVCWCVTRDGKKIPRTNRRGVVKCKQVIQLGPCYAARRERKFPVPTDGVMSNANRGLHDVQLARRSRLARDSENRNIHRVMSAPTRLLRPPTEEHLHEPA
ncbi:Thyroglobulin [Lamellibrachia satsuma]|nr:Thyroglobulin [Lamellibrachia satsuma]